LDNPDRLLQVLSYASELFKLLSDPTRLLIFMYLARRNEATVREIAEVLGKPDNLVSYHISLVKRLGLVTSRKSGRNVYYRIVDETIKKLVELSFKLAETRRDSIFKPRVKRIKTNTV